mmetsp:Transcript_24312/g.37459  ORF Transcript_24312/g.37459 Transcript_24312/m.37459 type:complete len:509 (+) Transcript_24312:112-1638(+)|eukprot:CAMPEP_0195303722 /NCGR_PEP_ID=MMETSP0707-20130614/33254_1 /TAXON_ID=33640 /ORGANISM="Asterionellopsis glacialis, Strain CCMP134" /LENGTH=508 /DNA_ID=CAMNT_0040367351 /DNA_START=80 /DNA_END=1606 /DNA_ORIENTATION=+
MSDACETTRLVSELEGSSSRSIDKFLDDAYSISDFFPFRYNLTILSLSVANSSFSASVLLMSYLLADDAFDSNIMHHDTTWRGSFLSASVFAGMLLGGVSAGAMCDHFGRKPILLRAMILNLVAGLVTAIAPNAITLILIRFIAGIGIGATEPANFTLIIELCPPSNRGFLVTFVASFWMVGNLHIAVVGLVVFQIFEWSWRVYVILSAIPTFLGLWMVWAYVPESPRFMATVKRDYDEAARITNVLGKQIVTKNIHKLLPYEIEEVQHQYKQFSPSLFNLSRETTVQQPISCATLSDLLYNLRLLYAPDIRSGTTLPAQVLWFSLAMGSYSVMAWINYIFELVKLENIYVNLLLFALANLPGNIMSFLVIDKIGRLPMLVWSLCFSAVSSASFAWFVKGTGGNVNTMAVMISACAFQTFETGAWNALDVMTGELFPTKVRSTAVGLCTATGRVGALISQFLSGALANEPVILLMMSCMFLLVSAVAPFFLESGDRTNLPLSDEVISC